MLDGCWRKLLNPQVSFALEPTEVAQLKVFLVGIGAMIISVAHMIVMRNVSAVLVDRIAFELGSVYFLFCFSFT